MGCKFPFDRCHVVGSTSRNGVEINFRLGSLDKKER